jgi:hypothetical protein
MTRFKELRRIEKAIEEQNKNNLDWALRYCQMRLTIATRKDHRQYWTTMESRVKTALGAAQQKEG